VNFLFLELSFDDEKPLNKEGFYGLIKKLNFFKNMKKMKKEKY
jgi:hypothetical protein